MVKEGRNESPFTNSPTVICCTLVSRNSLLTMFSSVGYLSTILCAVMKNYELHAKKVNKIFSPSNHTD